MGIETTAAAFADRLKAGDFDGANKFWSKEVVSIESMSGPMRELRGREAVQGKSDWWYANHKVHRFEAIGPFINGDQFAMIFKSDLTPVATGKRMKMEEVGVYTVKRGKIVEERFFNVPMGG
jgi:ketosteroid isomerase-like protein